MESGVFQQRAFQLASATATGTRLSFLSDSLWETIKRPDDQVVVVLIIVWSECFGALFFSSFLRAK